ncbi:MAG TPA: ATP synthase subunit I [Gammaproteobacteria bacterium]|nr:ATP synthase subunit I [Gammaproteobacteria bacterium]
MESRVKTAISVLAVQAAITLVASWVAYIINDARAALAAAVGGSICVLTTGLSGLRVFAGKMEFAAERFLQRLYRAEIQKMVLAAVLLAGSLVWLRTEALSLLLSFSAALMAYWLVLLFRF